MKRLIATISALPASWPLYTTADPPSPNRFASSKSVVAMRISSAEYRWMLCRLVPTHLAAVRETRVKTEEQGIIFYHVFVFLFLCFFLFFGGGYLWILIMGVFYLFFLSLWGDGSDGDFSHHVFHFLPQISFACNRCR